MERTVVLTYLAMSVLQGVLLKNALPLQKKDHHMALRIEVLLVVGAECVTRVKFLHQSTIQTGVSTQL